MIDVHLISDKNLFWQDPSWITAITGWIAAITGLTALIISFYVSRKSFGQQKSLTLMQLKSSYKEKHIEEFISQIVLFLRSSSAANVALRRLKDHAKNTAEKTNEFEILRREIAKTKTARLKIELYLNKQETLHIELSDLLEQWEKTCEQWRTINAQKKKPEMSAEDYKDKDNKFFEETRVIREKIVIQTKKVIEDERYKMFQLPD